MTLLSQTQQDGGSEMLAEYETQETALARSLHECYLKTPDSDPLKKIRAKAWDRFLDKGLPNSRWEIFQYMRLNKLKEQSFSSASTKEQIASEVLDAHIYSECRESCLVFVNGRYSGELSRTSALPKEFVVSELDLAIKSYGAFLNSRWTRSLKEDTDPFALLNSALHEKGVLLYLPPKIQVEAPLQILHLIDLEEERSLIFPRIQLFLGSQSSLKIVENTFCVQGENSLISSVCDIALDEGSHLKWTRSLVEQRESNWFFSAFRATQKRDSRLQTLSLTDGTRGVRDDYRVTLAGENCETELHGAWMLMGKHEAHNHVLIEHQAPHCRSSQLFKGVVSDLGRSSFEGKIYVHKEAQKTDAFQLNNNLLLSEHAEANSKPNLEIFADDVKASHGATVGQLNEEELFYLRTRGLGEAQARALLVRGFLHELTEEIALDAQKKEVEVELQQLLEHLVESA